jgi:hypothetical protein
VRAGAEPAHRVFGRCRAGGRVAAFSAMKPLLAATLALAIAGTGCVVVPQRSVNRSASSAEKCPPGHQGKDGRCYATGREAKQAGR